MTASSSFCALFSAASAFTLASASGCGTDAQGVDDCRAIEDARCEAAPSCNLFDDVDECQRFYRDQCLHGLPVTVPSSSVRGACVETIRKAGACAKSGADTRLRDCDERPSANAPEAKTACDLVSNPEKAVECAFLTPDADLGSGGAAGTDGGGSSESGQNSSGAAGE